MTPRSSSPSVAGAKRRWPRRFVATRARSWGSPAACSRHPRAEEVAQEIFLRLWNHPNVRPRTGSLRSCLLAQTHGRAVDLLRSESSRRAAGGAAGPSAAGGQATTSSARSGDLTSPSTYEAAVAAPARRAPGHRARLLRRPHLPRGRRLPRRPRGHHQEPHPHRPAPSPRGLAASGYYAVHDRRPHPRRARELLAPYALDAVDPDEAELIERHLRECPRCSAEVVEHRETAGALATAHQPAGTAVGQHRVDTRDSTAHGIGGVVPLRPPRWQRAAEIAVASVAAVSLVVLGVRVAQQDSEIDRLRGAARRSRVARRCLGGRGEP